MGGTRLPPVDQADENASFAGFRRELLGMIARRDADALLAIVDPNIRFTFSRIAGVMTSASDERRATGDYPSRKAAEIGMRAARIAGKRPPMIPMRTAYITPFASSRGPTSNANAT